MYIVHTMIVHHCPLYTVYCTVYIVRYLLYTVQYNRVRLTDDSLIMLGGMAYACLTYEIIYSNYELVNHKRYSVV